MASEMKQDQKEADTQDSCLYCDSTGWVCEAHPKNPWKGVSNRFDACECGPGIPCFHCNQEEVPRFPDGYERSRT